MIRPDGAVAAQKEHNQKHSAELDGVEGDRKDSLTPRDATAAAAVVVMFSGQVTI